MPPLAAMLLYTCNSLLRWSLPPQPGTRSCSRTTYCVYLVTLYNVCS